MECRYEKRKEWEFYHNLVTMRRVQSPGRQFPTSWCKGLRLNTDMTAEHREGDVSHSANEGDALFQGVAGSAFSAASSLPRLASVFGPAPG